MRMFLKFLLIFLPAFVCGRLCAQKKGQARIDSMVQELSKANDSNKVKMLTMVATFYSGENPDQAKLYATQALTAAKPLADKKWIGNAYNTLGNVYQESGNYPEALKNHFAALDIRKELGNKKLIGGSCCNIGNVYRAMGNYTEAIKMYFVGLKALEEVGFKPFLANTYYGIAVAYINIGNYPAALKNHLEALKLRKEIGDKQQIAYSYLCIGDVYCAQAKYTDALSNYINALKLQEEAGNGHGVAYTHLSICRLFKEQNISGDGLKHGFVALRSFQGFGDKGGIANAYGEIGGILMKQKDYGGAEKNFLQSLSAATEIGDMNQVRIANENLSKIYVFTGKFEQSLIRYKAAIVARDSMINVDNIRKIERTQLEYDFDKKAAIAAVLQEKKDVIAAADIRKQKLLRNTFVGGFALVLAFSTVVYRQRNRVTKERNLVTKEKSRSDELLLNILPSEVAEELKNTGSSAARLFNNVTILFTDFVDFTSAGERMTPHGLVNELDTCFKAFDEITHKYSIEKIKTIGDAYLAVGGLPSADARHAVNVVNAALDIQQFMLERRKQVGDNTFEIRIGVHSGSVVAGIVGIKKFAYDIWGDTVNTAARMEQNGAPGKINISQTTYELVHDNFECTYRGEIDAKNKGALKMYFIG